MHRFGIQIIKMKYITHEGRPVLKRAGTFHCKGGLLVMLKLHVCPGPFYGVNL